MNEWIQGCKISEAKDKKNIKKKKKKHQRSSKGLLLNSSLMRHSSPLDKIEYWFCYLEKLWDFSFVPLHSKRNAEEKN